MLPQTHHKIYCSLCRFLLTEVNSNGNGHQKTKKDKNRFNLNNKKHSANMFFNYNNSATRFICDLYLLWVLSKTVNFVVLFLSKWRCLFFCVICAFSGAFLFLFVAQARRSMRFAKHLRDIGDDFRRQHLDSDDVRDKTVLDEDWHKMEVGFHKMNLSSVLFFCILLYLNKVCVFTSADYSH